MSLSTVEAKRDQELHCGKQKDGIRLDAFVTNPEFPHMYGSAELALNATTDICVF